MERIFLIDHKSLPIAGKGIAVNPIKQWFDDRNDKTNVRTNFIPKIIIIALNITQSNYRKCRESCILWKIMHFEIRKMHIVIRSIVSFSDKS